MLTLVSDTPEDRDKFVTLCETYGKIIYYTLSRCNLGERTKEDLSHDIYIVLAEHLNSIDINDHKKTRNYITTVARSYYSDHLRSKNRHPEDFLDEIPEPQVNSSGILDYLIAKEQTHQLAKEVHKLDDIYKSVLELRYINGFSNNKIALFLRIKKKITEVRLYHANLILREGLKEQGDI